MNHPSNRVFNHVGYDDSDCNISIINIKKFLIMSGQIELNLQLPVIEGDDRSFRILYLHNVNKFSERENSKSEESVSK